MNIFEQLKRRVTTLDQNSLKTTVRKYTPVLGERVVHVQSKRAGKIIGVATLNGLLVLDVLCDDGKRFTSAPRMEFMLANGDRSYIGAPEMKVAETPAPPIATDLKGEIEMGSILDEITR